MEYGYEKSNRKKLTDREPIWYENQVALYRKIRGMSQEELGKAARVSKSTIYLIESRLIEVKMSTALHLAQALGVEVADLFFSPEKKPPFRSDVV